MMGACAAYQRQHFWCSRRQAKSETLLRSLDQDRSLPQLRPTASIVAPALEASPGHAQWKAAYAAVLHDLKSHLLG
jgi:hypothetical protein